METNASHKPFFSTLGCGLYLPTLLPKLKEISNMELEHG